MSAGPNFISPKEVMAQLQCSRTTAYALMRRAVQREHGARGLLRVPRDMWEAFIENLLRFGTAGEAVAPKRRALPHPQPIRRVTRAESLRSGINGPGVEQIRTGTFRPGKKRPEV